MEILKERQKNLLSLIVNAYVKTVSPVGSKTISEHYRNEFSPATIRNEMHELETKDYIMQPHTSAGRVPTDKGYRYYVDHLMPEAKVPPHVAALVAREYRERVDNLETLIERTSKILSTFSEQAGFVVFPAFHELMLKHIELTALGRKHWLVVWVTTNGFVQDRMIDMKEEIPAEELLRINRFLNQELRGLVLSEIESHLERRLSEARDSLRTLCRAAREIVHQSFSPADQKRFFLEGSHHILEQPEFQDWEKSRRLFKTLESKEFFMDLVKPKNPSSEGVRVQIGFEHHCKDIWDCSFVTARYQLNQRTVGTLGVLGPRRMPYERMVSLVDYVSRRLGEVLEQWSVT